MSNSLDLTFTDNPKGEFYPNQVITGTVELRLKDAVKARGLRLIIKGKAECKWTDPRGIENRDSHSDKEVFLNSVTYMFGSENGEAVEVSAGVHTYNFQCHLPESLPYSVEGSKGFVRYRAEATLDIPWGPDYEAKKKITVVRYDDLNLVESVDYRQPCEVEGMQTFGCLCWQSEPLVITMRVLKTGFGLGEKIPIHVQLVNHSSKNVTFTEFRLEKIEQLNKALRSHQSASLVSFKIGRGVHAGHAVEFVEYLEIPINLATSSERFCKVFQIRYQINLKLAPDGSGTPPDMRIGITIGNVGLMDISPSCNDEENRTVSPASTLPSVSSPQNDSPPTFDEATATQRLPVQKEPVEYKIDQTLALSNFWKSELASNL